MPALAAALDRLDVDRADFLAAYDALTPRQRSLRPADGGWTADEVLQHVVKTETGSHRLVSAQAETGAAPPGLAAVDPARLDLVEAFLRSDGRTTMPSAAVRFITPDSPPDAGWRERLGAFGDVWRALDASLPADLRDVPLMDHPRAGPLTAAGAVRFVAAHLDHHRRQIARLCAAPGFPE